MLLEFTKPPSINMAHFLKKILILLPVTVTGIFFSNNIYHRFYEHSSNKRITGLIVSVLLLLLWTLIITFRRKQENIIEGMILSSYFVYIFFVLQLTGYFILFREISSHDWWGKMMHRIDVKDHVNLELFKTIDIYNISDKQIAGNFIMLLPLGIYLPILYKRLRKFTGFFLVAIISFLVSVGIEVLQLATNFRSTDIDDVLLNTAGGCTGFIIFMILKKIILPDQKEMEAKLI